MNKKDFYTGLAFLVLTGVIFALILDSPSVQVATKPGPFFFPSVAAVLLGGLSLALLISGAKQKGAAGDTEKKGTKINRVVWITVWCVIYAVTIERLGYLVSTGIVTFALLWYFNRRGWVFNIILAAATPISIFILFDSLLKQSLPRGFLGF